MRANKPLPTLRLITRNLSRCGFREIKHRLAAWRSWLNHHQELSQAIQSARQKAPLCQVICISKTQHMGDILACEPVARQVRREIPDAFIVWCLQKNYAELMRHHPAVDYVLAVECLTEWMLFAGSPLFDRVIDLEMSGKPCTGCQLRLEKKNDFGVTFENYYRLGTLLEVYLRCANYQVEDKAPQIYFPADIQAKVAGLLPANSRYVTVHCSSNESCRDWKIEKWAELLRWLSAEWQMQIIEVGVKPALSQLQLPNYRSLCGQLSILETAEVIRQSMLFVGVDSGPAHLANAVGTRGVLLIGSYAGFVKYQPYNGNFADPQHATLVYSTEAAAEIPVNLAQAAVALHLRAAFSATAANNN